MTNAIIIIRHLTRPGCNKCKAMAHYIDGLVEDIRQAGGIVSEHPLNVEFGLLDKYDIKPEDAPVLVFERSGMEVARIKGIAAPDEILDVLAHAREVR